MVKLPPKRLKEINMILFGASGHCKSVIDISESVNEPISYILDDNPKTDTLFGISVRKLSVENDYKNEKCVIAIGNNKVRKSLSLKLHFAFATLIHKTASVSKRSTLGCGTVVMAKAIINAAVIIGKHCIINSAAVIEHDCYIEDYVHISPNASLAGEVIVGEGAHIGIGACVLQGIKIGKWATIGAGAVVIKDVPDYAVVVGNPAKIIKNNN
jgi:acetyltransferase EpsM